jgi:SNF2 family DNA or RNA helicase
VIEGAGRIDVYNFTDEHKQIARILGASGLTVPMSAREKVLESIAAISPLLTIHSNLEGVQQSELESIDADPRLHINLQPSGGELKMNLVVQPFGAGPGFLPGQGGSAVFAEIDGRRLHADRNLDTEKALLQEVLDLCPGLVDQAGGQWLFPDLEQALEGLLRLQEMGDTLVLSWPEGKKITLRREVGVSTVSLSVRSKTDWFEIDGDLLTTESDVLDIRKLLALIGESPGRFVRLGDNEFIALTSELRMRLDQLQGISRQGRIHPLAGFHLDEIADGMSLNADAGWQQFQLRLNDARDLKPELPTTFAGELREYQFEGFAWLTRLSAWGAGACLADDMGLGKTIQSLALILNRAKDGPTLIVAPTSVCMNWMDEACRFAPTLNPLLFGPGDRIGMIDDLKPFDMLVCSYGLLTTESSLLTSVTWRTIVADEAQAFKNANTHRSKAIMNLEGDFRVITTGTPIENHLGELWNLFHFINRDLLGSLNEFNREYARAIESGDAEVRQHLKNLISPFVLRRLKRDVLTELPPRTDITLSVELSAGEAALYEALRREALSDVHAVNSENQRRMIVLAQITRLRRVVCNPALVVPDAGLPSAKLAVFGELVSELLENQHKALVFSQFVGHLALIRNYLDERGVFYQYLDGSTRPAARRKAVNAFQAGEGQLFLISLKAGGLGLNLTAADYVIHMDPWWNPAVEDQASDRAHRIGQRRPVTVYRLVAADTIEQKIVELHRHKRDLADRLLEGTDVSARMSFDEMLSLIGDGETVEALTSSPTDSAGHHSS